MAKKKEIMTTNYFDVLENVKKCIVNSQYKVMTSVGRRNYKRSIYF